MKKLGRKIDALSSRFTNGNGLCVNGYFRFAIMLTSLLLSGMAGPVPVHSAQARYNTNDQETAYAYQKMQSSLDSCRLQLGNHDNELRMHESKLENFETILEALNQQLEDYGKNQKELIKKNGEAVETKVQILDSSSKKMIDDLKKLQTHANETTSSLTQSAQKIVELEKMLDVQNQNMEQLKATLKLLMELFQDKNGIALEGESSGKTYRIQPGDSLEKIAKTQHTSVQKIKDLNSLTSDRIIVGKLLKIPE